jgi:hypothetical protein
MMKCKDGFSFKANKGLGENELGPSSKHGL